MWIDCILNNFLCLKVLEGRLLDSIVPAKKLINSSQDDGTGSILIIGRYGVGHDTALHLQ